MSLGPGPFPGQCIPEGKSSWLFSHRVSLALTVRQAHRHSGSVQIRPPARAQTFLASLKLSRPVGIRPCLLRVRDPSIQRSKLSIP